MDDAGGFIGHEYYDYYESVTARCTWPDCDWKEEANYWSNTMQRRFAAHFVEMHADSERGK